VREKAIAAKSHEEVSAKASELVSAIVHDQNKKIVLIGESSHGTSEFYETRAMITRRLIEAKQCFAVVLEADLPPCAGLHHFVNGADMTIMEAMQPFAHRFPSWMWANEEMKSFVEWLRDYNMNHPEKERVSVVGMDLYSLQTSMKDVIAFLKEKDAVLAARVEHEYSCFGDGKIDPQTYGMLVEKGLQKGCANAAKDACLAIVERASALKKKATSEEDLRSVDEVFINELNAFVVQGAESYYRSMFAAGVSSWNVRDRHFMDVCKRTMDHLAATRGQNYARVAVWAHNSHVGNAHWSHLEKKPHDWVTAEKRHQIGGGGGEAEHELNIGQLAKEMFPEEALLVGQFTYTGTVACADNWDSPQRVKNVRIGLINSMEDVLHSCSGAGGNLIVNLTDAQNAPRVMKTSRLQRAIGVIYRPDTERWSHYYTCHMANQFDVVLWHDSTTAVSPILQFK